MNTNEFKTMVDGYSVEAWEQFFYRNPAACGTGEDGAVFIQYWILNGQSFFGSNCDVGGVDWTAWETTGCYTDSILAETGAPEPASYIYEMSLSGQAYTSGDQATFCFSTNCTASNTSPDYLGLGKQTYWTLSEFNVFGWGGGSEAEFSNGQSAFSLGVTDSVTASIHASILCDQYLYSGESNNLLLGSCSSTQFVMQFSEET